MKRKKFLATMMATALSASMLFTAVPTFASVPGAASDAVEYDETSTYDHVDAIDDAVKTIFDTNWTTSSANFNSLTDSSTADDIAAAIETALGSGYTVAADSAVTKGNVDTNGYTPLTATYTIKNSSASAQYEITIKAKSDTTTYKTNSQKADAVSKDVVKYLSTYKGFSATGDVTSADVVAVIKAYLSGKSDKSDQQSIQNASTTIGYRSVTVDADASTESTTSARGSVAGKITFSFPAHKALYLSGGTLTETAPGNTATPAVAAEDAVSVTVDFTAQRAFANETLTATDAQMIANYLDADGTCVFQNNADATVIAARANAYIKGLSKSSNAATAAKWRGVTASVSGVIKQDPQAHGAATTGTFSAKLTLTKGSETATADIVDAKYVHSDSEKLDEVDAAITKASTDFSTAKYQRANATSPVAATKTQNAAASVEAAVEKVLQNAVDSKVNDVALDATGNGDGWNKSTGITVTVKDTTDKSTSTGSADWLRQTETTAKGPQRIDAKVLYTPATVKTEGKAEVVVTSYVIDSEAKALGLLDGTYTSSSTNSDIAALTKTTSFTLTFSKLKASADTYLNFSKGSYNITYNSDATDEKYNSFKIGDNAAGSGVSGVDSAGHDVNRTDVPYIEHDGNDELGYSSSDTDVAIVDDDGNVVLKGTGTATITVTDKDNSKLSATLIINSTDKFVFDDVQDPDKFYYDAVKDAYTASPQVTSGISASEFGINQKVTRGQFITWMYRAAGEPKVATSNKFSDVASTAYYAKAVAWGVSEGIVAGTSDTTFAPNDVVTREQAVTFLYRAYGDGDQYTAPVDFFTDVNSQSYAYNAIIWAYKKDITYGKTVSSFAPKDDVLRTDGITFVYRANGKKF